MTRTRLLGLLAATGLVVAGCGGGDIEEADSRRGGGEECGRVQHGDQPVGGLRGLGLRGGQLAANELGCDVEYKNLKEELAWQGFGTGEVDVVIENWGHDDLKKKYIEEPGHGRRGRPDRQCRSDRLVVPPWLAEEYPDITDWQNLNKYADKFATSSPAARASCSMATRRSSPTTKRWWRNLDLDYKVVYAGSEAALIQTFRQAEANKEWVLGYFYDPQWFMSEVPLVKVDLPPYKPGCDVPAEEVDCDYPEYNLDKIASKEFMESGSPAAELVENFEWTNEDQNVVAKYIAQDGMSQEDAAEKWIEDNPRHGRGLVAQLTDLSDERARQRGRAA
jgi:glycine betaine/proline transport system substrate-binding protein